MTFVRANPNCPKCGKELEKVKGRYLIFSCTEHGKFKKKRNRDYLNPKNWRARCDECGGTMDYHNLRYCCRKCGHILEV